MTTTKKNPYVSIDKACRVFSLLPNEISTIIGADAHNIKLEPMIKLWSIGAKEVYSTRSANGVLVLLTEHGKLYELDTEPVDGREESMIPKVLFSKQEVISLSCSASHVLFCAANGDAYGMGGNMFGQLGTETIEEIKTPTLLPQFQQAGVSIKQVGAGNNFSVFLDSTGKLWSCGSYKDGRLGHGEKEYKQIHVPVKVACDEVFESVAVGWSHAIALSAAGTIWAWGNGKYGELGLGDKEDKFIPTEIPASKSLQIVNYGAGFSISAFLTGEGEVYVFGAVGVEPSSRGSTEKSPKERTNLASSQSHHSEGDVTTPTIPKLFRGKKIEKLACSTFQTAGLDNKGTIHIWNHNERSYGSARLPHKSKISNLICNVKSTYATIEMTTIVIKTLSTEPDGRIGISSDSINFPVDHSQFPLNHYIDANLVLTNSSRQPARFRFTPNFESGNYFFRYSLHQGTIQPGSFVKVQVSLFMRKPVDVKTRIHVHVAGRDVLLKCNVNGSTDKGKKRKMILKPMKMIGEGNQAKVYQAIFSYEDGVYPQVVAAKFFKEKYHHLCERECEILGKLLHPRVITYFRSIPDQHCMITEYYPKGNLYDLIRLKKIDLTVELQISILLDIASGMEYLHNAHYIHRDLKTLNILVSEDGRAVICDFGTTREESAMMSRGKGTALWMAPEVILGRAYTKKADVFSFGIVVFEVVAKRRPYSKREYFDVKDFYTRVTKMRMRPEIPKDCPEFLEVMMTRCWHTVADVRPTFTEVRNTLEQYQGVMFFMRESKDNLAHVPM